MTVTGRVTATNGRRPLEDVLVTFGGQTVRTDSTGTFRLEWAGTMPPGVGRVTLEGRLILARSTGMAVNASRSIELDAISIGDGFSLDYYRQLVRDGYEHPNELRPLRRWTRAPMIYLRTVDDQGQAIDEATLGHVARAIGDDTGAFTGERFGIAGIERGTGSREGVSGWITVKWPNPAIANICGRAQVAVDGGWIQLNHLNPGCSCGSSRIGSATVRHEIGHALGFFHTSSPDDLMFNTVRVCDGAVSSRERLHAAIAYSRPNGNVDPDTDPQTTVNLRSLPVVVLP